MKIKSATQHAFSMVPRAEIPRSSFDRSHGHKTTFDAGVLIPIYVDEALPGDTFNLKMTAFGRLATPIFPLMDNLYLDTFFFAVPNRLLWDNWQKFNGEQLNPGDSTDFLVPTITSPVGGYLAGTIYDYMGLPTVGQVDPAGSVTHSALPLRAYAQIYNEWFRDENLCARINAPTGDGPDLSTGYGLQRRGKRHDYFTSCLPWPQKGDSVELPLGTSAPVTGIGFTDTYAGAPNVDQLVHEATGLTALYPYALNGAGQADLWIRGYDTDPSYPRVVADLSSATAATINQLRQAFQVQRMLERDARGGSRYTEIIRAHFGVTSPDARMQRPEYLGGGSAPIVINSVPQTSGTPPDLTTGYAATPQGNLAAFGTVSVNNHGFTKSFTEHCTIIGLAMVRADLTYQQGLNRMWSRQTRFDFYWPALAQIGEQAVLRKELYVTGMPANDEAVFGYQERFAEYRYKPSMITGRFKSTDATPLDAWHLAQEFVGPPTLSQTFIEEDPPIDRVIAVPAEPHFIFDSLFSLRCARPMPLFGVPGMIDHF